ncbi:MAG: metal-dependent transcriptional regulator, partial [Oscillospiraceae bacterium]|nr:metal-dependent transcriptional regulator [Oscillospiraceae bacterium]
MKIQESAEDYLETILILSRKLPVVRSVDIANELGFKKSSVSVAMKNLREKNHITVT